jgi:hypothetical protein
LFDSAVAPGEDVVGGDPIDPGPEGRLATVRSHAGHDPDKDLLGGVLGVLGMPQHAEGETVDVVAHGRDDLFDGGRVAVAGL